LRDMLRNSVQSFDFVPLLVALGATMRVLRSRFLIAVATAIVTATVVGSVAWAVQSPVDNAGVVHACYNPTNGNMHLDVVGHCPTTGQKMPITWNAQGPPGQDASPTQFAARPPGIAVIIPGSSQNADAGIEVDVDVPPSGLVDIFVSTDITDQCVGAANLSVSGSLLVDGVPNPQPLGASASFDLTSCDDPLNQPQSMRHGFQTFMIAPGHHTFDVLWNISRDVSVFAAGTAIFLNEELAVRPAD